MHYVTDNFVSLSHLYIPVHATVAILCSKSHVGRNFTFCYPFRSKDLWATLHVYKHIMIL